MRADAIIRSYIFVHGFRLKLVLTFQTATKYAQIREKAFLIEVASAHFRGEVRDFNLCI